MKQFIITALFVIVTGTAFCQTKPDTAKKPTPPAPQFQPNLNKQFDIALKVPGYLLQSYFYMVQNPGFESSDKLKGSEIVGVKRNAGIVVDSLYSKFEAVLRLQYKAFTDSIAHTKIKHK